MKQIKLIENFLHSRYAVYEYPALAYQFELWSKTRPLAGIKVLDGTPVFANTLLKYMNLLAAGAELTVGYCDSIPYDPKIIDFLQRSGKNSAHKFSKLNIAFSSAPITVGS